jgi:hypothetical protein
LDTGSWNDLRSLLRTIPLAGGILRTIAGSGRKAREFGRAFERSVRPLFEETIADTALRAELAGSALSYVTKSSFVVAGYARMAGVPFAGDIAMLGLSFTRLYDDLLDGSDDRDLEGRLGALIGTGRFTPASDPERLLDRMYREIDDRLGRDRDDPLYTAAVAAHSYQARSRCQRDPRTTHAAIAEVTHGKGGYGTLTVFALMRPGLSARERELIIEIGESLQMLDDYADVEQDRRDGIRTMATEGRLRLADVGHRLRALRPALARYYGPRGCREFLGICYLAMWICFIGRRWSQLSRALPPRPSRAFAHRPAAPGEPRSRSENQGGYHQVVQPGQVGTGGGQPAVKPGLRRVRGRSRWRVGGAAVRLGGQARRRHGARTA